jgi:hypothetical protein
MTTEVRVMESPWFISVGKNSGEEVSVSFRLHSRTTHRLTSIVPCIDRTPLLCSTAGDIFGMWIAYDKFAKIDPKDIVEKLNKSTSE